MIKIQKNKENKKNIWEDSLYKNLPKLQSNNVGEVGESFIQKICNISNIPSNIDGKKTRGNGIDGTINNKSVEIKTSTKGITKSFQHELGENPWKSQYMIFIDIAPSSVYLTIFPNFTENEYKSCIKCKPYFPTRSFLLEKKIWSI